MRDWRDLNGDGEIDGAELMFAEEILCTIKEEHEALFGNAGSFGWMSLKKIGKSEFDKQLFF